VKPVQNRLPASLPTNAIVRHRQRRGGLISLSSITPAAIKPSAPVNKRSPPGAKCACWLVFQGLFIHDVSTVFSIVATVNRSLAPTSRRLTVPIPYRNPASDNNRHCQSRRLPAVSTRKAAFERIVSTACNNRVPYPQCCRCRSTAAIFKKRASSFDSRMPMPMMSCDAGFRSKITSPCAISSGNPTNWWV